MSNQLVTSGDTSSSGGSSVVQMDMASRDALLLFITEIQEAQTNFNAEREIFPAASRIEAELASALQCALDANDSFSLGNLIAVRTHLREAIDHLELSLVLISHGESVNPIDVASYMVRQHYVDFLDREPEEAGGDFWSNEITSCGRDVQCVEVKRIHVSAAFFLSIESKETGFFVYRLYKSSYGRMPLRQEFMPDMQSVARGVIVGKPGWEATLAANKQAFLEDWVQRDDFVSRYSSLLNTEYVDALISNLEVNITTQLRRELVRSLTNGASRASVLGRLAENEDFTRAQLNSAFVFMQYAGYLRRDPDIGGFNFWLGKLNQFNGDYGKAEMVKAFLSSLEYRRRFAL